MNHAAGDVPNPPGARRGGSGSAAALLTLGTLVTGGLLVAPARAAGSPVPASQRLVTLVEDSVARTRPDGRARRIRSVAARRPLTGVRTVLPVLRYARSGSGGSWAQVRLPGRPNGHTGWIRARGTRRASTEWHLSVKLSTRQVTVYRGGRVERRFKAVIGAPATPTPRGRFFVEEAVALASQDAGAPFALALSARSQVLQEFNGGPGQIALHGIDHLPDALGSAASHGCVRLSTRAITWLARRIGGGVPLTVKG